MINYENSAGPRASPRAAPEPKDPTVEQFRRLENLVAVQNQKIEQLDREVRKLKTELRSAVSAFNQQRRT
jgi:hypothetical protein